MSDDTSPPEITGLAKKLRTLERRRDELVSRLESQRGTEASLAYDKAEISALDAGVDALRYHWTIVSRLDTPLAVLRELLEAVDTPGSKMALADAKAKAKETLDEFEA
jgi:hypothetical protein